MNRRVENALWRLLSRRLKSAKGTVYFEFAVMMPLVMVTMFFAVDFTRALYCEQQIEIASRALCDVQCHITPGTSISEAVVPNGLAKAPVREYLKDVLEKEGLGRYGDSDLRGAVYCRATVETIPTLVNKILSHVAGFFDPDEFGTVDNDFVRILGKILGGILNFLTFRTDKYFIQPIGRDLMVRGSVSVVTHPLIRNAYWKTFFGTKHGTENTSSMLLAPWQYRLDGDVFDRDVVRERRDRYYCAMPLLDTLPMSPGTYVKSLSKVFPWLFK